MLRKIGAICIYKKIGGEGGEIGVWERAKLFLGRDVKIYFWYFSDNNVIFPNQETVFSYYLDD